MLSEERQRQEILDRRNLCPSGTMQLANLGPDWSMRPDPAFLRIGGVEECRLSLYNMYDQCTTSRLGGETESGAWLFHLFNVQLFSTAKIYDKLQQRENMGESRVEQRSSTRLFANKAA